MTLDTARVAPEVARYLDALPAICERHSVSWLDLFGSAVNGDFVADRSDVDILVGFRSVAPRTFAAYFELKEELEALFGRQVDLVEDGSIKNPHRLASIMASRLPLYP